MPRSFTAAAAPAVLAAAALLLTASLPAQADVPVATVAPAYSATTSVGVHNAYETGTFPYFADALDSGAGLLELDVWTNFSGSGWRVSHSNPLGNDNNCENAATAADLRTGPVNQSLAGCLADIRAWHEANPGHPPIQLKIELKDGFADNLGRGPDELDALINDILGDAVYGPGDLTAAGGHATLDEAVQAGGFPGRAELAGRFLVHLIPGTVEQGNPFDQLWTDEEYGTHLRDLAAAGTLDRAAAFPAVLGAEAGDPRTSRYEDAAIRPWFVVFDGDATAYTQGGIDTAWYTDRNYLLIMTAAHGVPPAIDPVSPGEAEALARVHELAAAGASIVTSDWSGLPTVLSTVVPRG
ncbi:phosphatidylinositol-specific phospholipase C domain-containing protein [Streptomyces sp. MP131-18]|uniref:phosphatidylinositol-specific phospholipase C domain-containing protein n=1 Tax=Streptomyces sp. MP131-18 TaxID=1857892 RepID=UPI00097C5B6D|nr:phosphatidylinositol-specific phospholipase C domain-containing protein [Streptomyces sp. MP131-18]ONK14875.1 hypothetical protein STBA_56670 [Streptomyces sp. MP131-18]